MRRPLWLTLLLALPAAFSFSPVHACSVNWKKGFSPMEVRRRPDVKEIKGIYKLEALAGDRRTDEDGVERVYGARFLGTITSESGRKWKTIHEPVMETGITCVDSLNAEFQTPERDAQGTFWIAIGTKRGRHTLRDWEGKYLPRPGDNETKQKETAGEN
jgi:hypothetical protein